MKEYISISCLPLPTFIEGNKVIFQPGTLHPNRTNLKYFVMIFLTKGKLYIAEDGQNYTVNAGEMMILKPHHHHYSWKPMTEQTEYYWIHFYVSGNWNQSNKLTSLRPLIEVPNLHYKTPLLTLHLLKFGKITNFTKVLEDIDNLFKESTDSQSFGFWQSQQLFIDLLQSIQIHSKEEGKLNELTNEILNYLRHNFANKVTNRQLGEVFHFHPNYISRVLKKKIGLTPSEFLIRYRMEEAEKRLLNTDMSISEIAESIGFQNIYYFSTSFKKYTGFAPHKYREIKKINV